MEDKTKYWIDLSEYDLDTAKAMLDTKRFLYVAFMRHQSIEKALKAYLSKISDSRIPHTHSLIHLVSITDLNKVLSEQHIQFLGELEPMNIEARYPTYKDELLRTLDYQYCNDLLNNTREFQQWIKKQL
jgi:HEPN domain-containing protein